MAAKHAMKLFLGWGLSKKVVFAGGKLRADGLKKIGELAISERQSNSGADRVDARHLGARASRDCKKKNQHKPNRKTPRTMSKKTPSYPKKCHRLSGPPDLIDRTSTAGRLESAGGQTDSYAYRW